MSWRTWRRTPLGRRMTSFRVVIGVKPRMHKSGSKPTKEPTCDEAATALVPMRVAIEKRHAATPKQWRPLRVVIGERFERHAATLKLLEALLTAADSVRGLPTHSTAPEQ